MAVVRCPACAAELEVDARHLAEPVACGACGEVFAAGGSPPRAARPVRRPEPDEYDEDDDYDDRPRRRRPDATPAYLPGLFSAIVCVLGLLLRVANVVVLLAFPQMVKDNPFFKAFKPPPVEVQVGLEVFFILWLLVALAASFRVMGGRSWGFARAGMMMQLLPCSGPCYVLGLPVAVWALVVLHRPEVVAGFERNAARNEERDDDRL